jgi:lysophospholipase L1-like esterase
MHLRSLFLLFLPAVAALGADHPKSKPQIVLVGDSTVTDSAGWGLGFKDWVGGEAECVNMAQGGRSSKSYLEEGHWSRALELKGDYYLIQFGHNDQPGKGAERETDPQSTFADHIRRYVDEARSIGAKPILVTSLTRRNFDSARPGKIKSTLTPYVEAVKNVAREKNVPLVDLHACSIALCEEFGPEKTAGFDPIREGRRDTTHLDARGSVVFARLVVEELRRVAPEIVRFLRAEPASVVPATTGSLRSVR